MGAMADKFDDWIGRKIGSAAVSTSKGIAGTKKATSKFGKGWRNVWKWNKNR